MVSNLSRPFTAVLPVRFTHTDPAGYVFFPRYFDMLHEVLETGSRMRSDSGLQI